MTFADRVGSINRSLRRLGLPESLRRISRVHDPHPEDEETPDSSFISSDTQPELSCILLVGSTGTGKSSTIGKCLQTETKTGEGYEPVTLVCEKFPSQDDKTVWVDTRGWNDQDCTDDQIFREILTFLLNNGISHVAGIIWTIIPDIKSSAMLKCQAGLINLFHRNIWNNVIVVAKQSMNPAKECQGALQAAATYTDTAVSSIPHTGYRFYDEEIMEDMTAETKKGCNVKMDSEVQAEIKGLLSKLESPKKLVLKSERCQDCGAEGDPRLLSPYCHMAAHHVHTGGTESHHPMEQERFHLDEMMHLHMSETGEKGRLRRRWFTRIVPFGPLSKKRYSCCYRRENSQPCREVWVCCQSIVKGGSPGCLRRYACCQTRVSPTAGGCQSRWVCCEKEVSATGCRKECSKCHGDWGKDAGECFQREEGHNLGTQV